MIKTNLKYNDGAYKYWHSCKSCGFEKAYMGRLNKISSGCPKCNPRSAADRELKRVADIQETLKINTIGFCKESLQEIFKYEPEGVLTYKLTIGSKAQKGTVAGTISKEGNRIVAINRIKYSIAYLIWVYHYDIVDIGTSIYRINKVHSDTRIENLSLTKSVNSTSTFILKACKTHDYLYNYSKVDYTHNKNTVIIGCKIHGDFEQEAHTHLSGAGCPLCGKTGYKTSMPGTLYYLRIDSCGMYKIGITNNTVNDRFSVKELENITVLKEWEYINGQEAYDQEQKILTQFKHARYNGTPVLTSGNTEIFTYDVLDLDVPSVQL